MAPIQLFEQANLTSNKLPADLPVQYMQMVRQSSTGTPEAVGIQEEFVLEFTNNIGDVAHAAADAPTATEYNALVAQFNELIAKMEDAGILQRPNGD